MLNQIRKILTLVIITSLVVGGGLPFGEQPAIAAEMEELDLSQIEWPDKGHPKLDSQLNKLVAAETPQKAAILAQKCNIRLVNGDVRVIIECLPEEIDNTITVVGELGNLETSYRNLLQATVPVTKLTTLANMPGIHLVRLPWYPLPTVISQGVGLINADGWQTAGYTGEGVKIAILDPGFTGYSSLLGTELPSSVTTMSFYTGSDIEGDTDHGTACAEIVYDIAPDADFYLVNFNTSAEMGNAVNWLIAQEVDIISCSVVWPIGGPGDGTGLICEMVDAARATGIFWSNSIGNSAQRHWQGDFVDTDSNGIHDFDPGVDESNAIYAQAGDTIIVALKWDDTWNASGNNYDLFLFDNATPSNMVESSTYIQDGDDYPIEGLSYTATYTGVYHIVIGTPGSFTVVDFHLYSYNHYLQYQVAAGSLCVPSDSPNAVAVGAVPWNNPTQLEPFSSRGPTKDGRKKPDLVAPDGVTSATYNPFFGTSASAPYVAGAAALVKERYPSYNLGQIQSFLEEQAVDLGPTGKDNRFGSGRLDLGLWYPEIIPSTAGMGIATGTDVIDLAVNGDTIYAAVQDATAKKLYKSTDAGATWADMSSTTDYPSVDVTMVAVSPDDASVIIIATSDNYLYYSLDGGDSWDSLDRPATNAIISDIDISGLTGGYYYIAAGGTDGSGNAELYTYKLAMAQSWVAQYDCVSGNATPNQYLIKAVKFSPNFQIDKIIGVVSGNSTRVSFQCFHYEKYVETWNQEIDGFNLNWGTGITTGNITAPLSSASIAFVSSYNGTDDDKRIVFIGWADSATPADGDVVRLTDTYLKSVKTWNDGPAGPIQSLACHDSGTLLAGEYDKNSVLSCLSPMDSDPKFERVNSYKQPGGEDKTIVGWSCDDAVAATSGDESAFAVSTDDGFAFNDISMIDTDITYMADVAISANATRYYLTTHDAASAGTNDVSIWLKEGTAWQRVLSLMDTASANAPFLVRVAPEDGSVVYLSSNGTWDMWTSTDSGKTSWKKFTCYRLDYVQDFVVESADVVYAIDSDGCSKTTNAGSGWAIEKSLDGVTGYMITLAPNSDILVGGSGGYVAFSKDGGSTFTRTKQIASTGNLNVQVIADKDYASNNIIYTGVGTNVYRGAADNTTDFVNRGPTIDATHTIVGIAQYMHVIYVLSSSSSNNALHRALNLKMADTPTSALWSSKTTTHTLNATPQALKLSAGPKLWAIDTNEAKLYSCTDIIEPDITVNPSSKNFGTVQVDSSSAAQKITITNDGTADLNIGTISIGGQHATEFSITNDNASGKTLTPYTSATLKVTFSPNSSGSKSASLDIPSDDPDEPLIKASLKGKGNEPSAPSGGGGGGGGGGALKPGIIALSDYIRSNGVLMSDVTGESEDKKCVLILKKGTKCLTEYDRALKRIIIFEAEEPPAPPEGCSFIGVVYDIGPDGAKFDPPITLFISYDPEALQDNIAEDKSYIACWDGSQWSALESVVDIEASKVSTEISHFTQFAIIGEPSPPPKPTPAPPAPSLVPEPANFVISDLSVTPSGVKPREKVTISVTVTNTGGTEGSYTVVLYINGVEESRTEVTLEAGKGETLTFTTVGSTEGSYTIDVNGEAGWFTVIAPPPKTITPFETTSTHLKTKWWLIGGITGGAIAGFVIVGLLVYFFVWRKRGVSRPA